MTIHKNSRYSVAKIDFVQTTPDVTSYPKPIVFYPMDMPSSLSFYEHNYVEGERFDQLASNYYKNPKLWWYIAELNPHIKDINNITPGTVIRIPRV